MRKIRSDFDMESAKVFFDLYYKRGLYLREIVGDSNYNPKGLSKQRISRKIKAYYRMLEESKDNS